MKEVEIYTLLFTRYRRHAGLGVVRERADCFRQGCEGFGHQRQGLPDGTAMPLGELQENLHVGEGLPLKAVRSTTASGRVNAALEAIELHA
jgi:hypothetical protein